MKLFLLLILTVQLMAQDKDWTQYGGTHGNWKAAPTDKTYLRDWSKAKLIWESEVTDIGSGRGQSHRYGARNGIPVSAVYRKRFPPRVKRDQDHLRPEDRNLYSALSEQNLRRLWRYGGEPPGRGRQALHALLRR